jgi:zinc protease
MSALPEYRRRLAAAIPCGRAALSLLSVLFIHGTVNQAAASSQSIGDAAAPLAAIVAEAKLPYEQFVLANGLRVIVSTDRKAPIVAVSVWYHVGSKDEPEGKTGFAHLFEHLMATGNGSENMPGAAAAEALERAGATVRNASTWFDRTNYYETVPLPALPLALFVESDRMGHLLGAIDQATLDRQRGVVQNEKRQGDNSPYGLVRYAQQQTLFPPGHPYHHTVIGSMEDLDNASLDDVRGWFRGHYGPNNAVLVLAGDIDVATAKPLVEKYFGDIPRGAQPAPTLATVPTLLVPKNEVMHDDQITTARLYRMWSAPAITDPDTPLLDIACRILAGLSSARLDATLIRQGNLALRDRARLDAQERGGSLVISVDARSNVDPALVSQRLDAVIHDFLALGPTADEVLRAATQAISDQLFELDKVGGHGTQRGERGKMWWLGEGALYANDPGFYAEQLSLYARATPESVRAAMQKWLSRPTYSLTILPGPRTASDEAKAVRSEAMTAATKSRTAMPSAAAVESVRRPPLPGESIALSYPKVERANLPNGLRIVYARRSGLPITRMVFSFDAGRAADPEHGSGTEALMLSLLDRGTPSLDATQIGDAVERLGARMSAQSSMDRAEINFAGLSANLASSLSLIADLLIHSNFADIEQLRTQHLAAIAAESADPTSIAWRILPARIYGRDHPYGRSIGEMGDQAAVMKLSRDDLRMFKDRWLRPDKGTIFIVSDRPFATLEPILINYFGKWSAGVAAAGEKRIDMPVPEPKPAVLLLDKPGAMQSVITAVEVLSASGTDDLLPLTIANDVLGGENLLSRLNMDIRQTHGWSYFVRSDIDLYIGRVPFWISAPVQTDKTGVALDAIRSDVRAFLTTAPITQSERDIAIEHRIHGLPGSLASSADLIDAMKENDTFKRPDDYYTRIADRLSAMTADRFNATARSYVDPDRLVWLIVGDAAKVRPQLVSLGVVAEELHEAGAR